MFVSENENIGFWDFLETTFSNFRMDESGRILSFQNVEKEYESLRYGVGARISNPSYLEVEGEDALGFLQRLSTQDVSKASEEKKISALFLNESGRIIDRVRIFKDGQKFVILGSKIYEEKINLWFQRYLLNEKIQLTKRNDFLVFELLGMQAESFVTLLVDEKTEINLNTISEQFTSNFKYLFLKDESVSGIPRFKILIEKKNAKPFVEYLLANKSVFNFNFVGEEAFEIFRLENGIPKAPNEINDLFLPLELNLANEIDFTKSNFVGFEFAVKVNGWISEKRRLAIALFDKEPEFTLPFIVEENQKEIGVVSSKVFSRYLKTFIGLGVFNEEKINGDEEELNVKIKDEIFKIKFQKPPLKR